MPWGAIASFGVGLMNNAISQQNAAADRDWKDRMWQKQNAYNHPAAMADRMRAAGLNPYQMMGAEPAGSVGSSTPAQTIPLTSPLDALKTLTEVENLNALTNRTVTETEKLYRDISALDLAYERGLVDFGDYKKHLDAYWKAYQEASEYELQRDNLKADTAVKESQSAVNNTQSSLNEQTVESLKTKLPYEVKSMEANAALAQERATSEMYLRQYYTASSEAQRSLAVKNYAESRLLDVKTDIESAFGALQAEANLNKTELESRVIVPLADSLIALQQSAAMLNKDTIRHNKVTEDIQKEAVRIQRALAELKKNEFYYSMFKDAVDKMIPDADSVIKAIGNIL